MLRNTSLRYCSTQEEARAALKEIEGIPILATDISFHQVDEESYRPLLLLAGTDKTHYIFDLRRVGFEVCEEFFRTKSLKVMSSASEKLTNLYSYREIWVENVTDIVLLEQIITNSYFSTSEMKSLDELCKKYLELEIEKGRRILLDNVEGEIQEQVLEFLRIELLVIFRIFLEQVRRIKSLSLERVSRLESNAIRAFSRIQKRGIYFDSRGFVNQFREAGIKGLLSSDLLDEDEMARLFLKKAQLPPPISSLLEEFAGNYKDPAHTLTFNANELLKRINPETSRIHSTFIQIASASGRSSSHSPNLFAIPRSRIFRDYFRAPEGRLIITLDYSTFELGVLAALSKDPRFIKAFKERTDLHSYVAELIFGKKVSKTENPELRKQAKGINFGIVYGMTAHGISKRLNVTRGEASRLLDKYYMLFPTLYAYFQNQANQALSSQELRTLSGRRCSLNPFEGELGEHRKKVLEYVRKYAGKNRSETYVMLILKALEDLVFKRERYTEEMYVKRIINTIEEKRGIPPEVLREIDIKIHELHRFIRNMPIQGTAADIMKKAITDIDERFHKNGLDAFIVNIVHDEIVIEAGEEVTVEAAKAAKEIMEEASRFFLKEISVEVECNIGHFWGDNSENKRLYRV